ncbi:hypothetical protein CC117_04715 [Parafrankia colletiae]|uniref:WD40 repeat-containing protein n=2 Tax=Parafrankia colletiae TaxID=573497 RepID=A0A1S1QJC5_9ACTN|nr:hypothetical protein CC117_04715 [Parafrankia colletiae]
MIGEWLEVGAEPRPWRKPRRRKVLFALATVLLIALTVMIALVWPGSEADAPLPGATPEEWSHAAPLEKTLHGHTGWVRSVVFSPDGRTLASSSDDGTVRFWDMSDRTNPTRLGEPLTGHADAMAAVAYSPDGRTLATSSTDRTVRFWDVTDRTRPTLLGQTPTGHTDRLESVAFSPDGRILAVGSDDQTVRLLAP